MRESPDRDGSDRDRDWSERRAAELDRTGRHQGDRRDDWNVRHARTTGAVGDHVVRVRRPVWERNWQTRHGRISRIADD